ncbi:hypothetical protein BDZ97DRAFT_1927007 [Flammula alnicola]|nr:hypothetical protein BDZ97DRAFT_1927007 [Flammula alnicola]
MQPNRLGLGLRPPLPSYGQGPSMSALAQQQQMQYMQPQAQKQQTTLFVGSISGGITDAFLNQLLSACGPIKSFKRLITPANKPQGFGFAEFEDPAGALRAIALLNGVELPALEDGCANKKLLVKADEKTRAFLDAFQAHQMSTDEADLPETQRGLVISEIAQFRERAAKREREKMRDVRDNMPSVSGAPSGPKVREWGKPQARQESPTATSKPQGFGKGAQGYSKPVGFVKAEDGNAGRGPLGQEGENSGKTDEELEAERKEQRRQEEELSYKDRERRYEPRERTRIQALERAIARERAQKEAEDRDRIEIKARLDIWDDDESDELFYCALASSSTTATRGRGSADEKSRRFEEQEAENLRRESEDFLARQMDEMQALAEEQRKAGLLLDDGAPVRLNVSIAGPTAKEKEPPAKEKTTVFAHDEEEEDGIKKRRAPLVKLDFSVAETGEQTKERLERIRQSVPHDKETLFKSKVRWDGLTDSIIDRKLEPLVKRLMVRYLGEMEEEDLIMFVLEHLKDHKAPQKLIEGLEPVLEEEATELVLNVWRQIIFESMAYNEGLLTDKMLAD